MDNHRDDAADVLVIFGITGDLARRMTFRALYRLERRGLLDCPVIGVASDDITTEHLVKHAREAIVDSGQDVDDAIFVRLARRMSYLSGDVSDAALYRSLAAGIGDRERPVYYLEVPPSLFGPIVEQLGAAKLLRDGRVAVEKPFGRDLASARELDARLHRLLRESQILRVDHFLGKEPVLLHAAMAGDHQYFAREDSVEETWRIVQPLLDHPPDVRPYPRGSWGPEEAETLPRGHPRWQQPWLPEKG